MKHGEARRFRMKVMSGWRAGLAIAGLFAAAAHGQVIPSAEGAGQSLWVGAEYANLKAGFPEGSTTRLSGVGVFGNFNWNHRFGVEGRARFLNIGSWNGETEQDYLAGPRYTFLHRNKLRPYALFQVGFVKMQYPFSVGSGTFFAMAPGGGVEYRLSRKWSVRGSYEFQMLMNSPNFTNEPQYGIKPNGGIVGLSYRLR
jgi:opacity protein-like surface antigen